MSNETMKDDERAAFEAWAADRGFPLSGGTVCYANPGTEKAWEGWQARAASPQSGGKTFAYAPLPEYVQMIDGDKPRSTMTVCRVKGGAYQIPLYTRAAAPQAALTDEQITKVWLQFDHTTFNLQSVAIKFARALLNQATTESISDAETECAHTWIPNSGRGGHPVFRPGRVSYYPIMHIMCGKCNARTWVTEPEWKAKIERGEGQS